MMLVMEISKDIENGIFFLDQSPYIGKVFQRLKMRESK